MKTIFAILKNFKLTFIVALLCGLLAGAGRALLIIIISRGPVATFHGMAITFPLFFILLLILFVVDLSSNILLAKLSQKSIYALQTNLCTGIINLPLANFEKIGQARTYAILTQDIMALTNFVVMIPSLLISIILIIGGFIYLGIVSKMLLMIVASLLSVMVIFFILLDRKLIRKKFQIARDLIDRLFKALQCIVDGAKELRLNQERCNTFMQSELIGSAKACYENNYKAMAIFTIGNGVWQMLFYLLLGLLVFIPISTLKIDTIALLQSIMIIIFTISPLASVINVFPMLERSLISAKKILQLEEEIKNIPSALMKKPRQKNTSHQYHLELTNIAYTYTDDKAKKNFSLGPLNIKINSGEIIFLVGKNGSGKSTLIKLISGLYMSLVGKIILNNHLVDENNLHWYREHFSVIFYDYYLFETIITNKLADLDKRIHDIAEKLQILPLVEINQKRLITVAASDGQKRRLAFLNLILEDRPFCVFDEPTSDQDPEFKELFYKELLPDLKKLGKAILVVTHDQNYFSCADRVVFLSNGQVV